jgi:hypothetical protein
MRFCCIIILFHLIGCVPPSKAAAPQPETVVRKLYRQIVARHPLGIPAGADKKAIWPFLSTRLVQGLDTGQACEDDYVHQHPGNESRPDPSLPPVIEKPEFGWLERGLFSGIDEEALPADAAVERTEAQKDGSLRVYVRLTYKETFKTYGRSPDPQNKFSWLVAAIVITERGRFVVDDILFFKGNSMEVRSHLLDTFKECNGPHWIGDK